MTEQNQRVLDTLVQQFGNSIVGSGEFRDELTVTVTADAIVDIARFLKDDVDLRFDLLADVCGIDMATPENRFGVIYNLYSLVRKHRVRLKVFTDGENPRVPTVSGVWSAANWAEREAYDMFGIVFTGHPDLRRMYMPDEFEHFPLRKDFPLMGIAGSLPLPKK